MKRIIQTFFFIVVFLFISGCSQTDLNSKVTSQISPSSDTSEADHENFNKYQISGVEDDGFSKAMRENKIDMDYNNEYFNGATTTQEMIEVQQKYIDIWKQEMYFSIENLKTALNEKDRSDFNSFQSQWEENTIGELKYEKEVLENPEYDLSLGTAFNPLWLNEIRESYRQRTFRIKYILYLLETQNDHPIPLQQCLSLKFKY